MEIIITGADEFATLARRLKEAGAKDLRKELYAGINRSVKPLKQDVKDSTGDYLPGGYAGVITASIKIRVSRRGSGSSPGIRLLAKASTPSGGARELARLDKGWLRHPLWGNRKHWYPQRIASGFYTHTLEQDAPRVRIELVEAIRKVAAKIEAGI